MRTDLLQNHDHAIHICEDVWAETEIAEITDGSQDKEVKVPRGGVLSIVY